MISKEEVKQMALLARIGLVPEEVKKLQLELSHILESFQTLQEVEIKDIPTTSQSIGLKDVMRKDVVEPSLSHDETMQNAPLKSGAHIRVKAILQ